MKSKGLGDTVQKITKATGIEWLTKKMLGDDCGCDRRREALNRRFPYKVEMSDELRQRFEAVVNTKKTHFTGPESVELEAIYREVFQNRKKWPRGCSACSRTMMEDLLAVYDACKK